MPISKLVCEIYWIKGQAKIVNKHATVFKSIYIYNKYLILNVMYDRQYNYITVFGSTVIFIKMLCEFMDMQGLHWQLWKYNVLYISLILFCLD